MTPPPHIAPVFKNSPGVKLIFSVSHNIPEVCRILITVVALKNLLFDIFAHPSGIVYG